MQTDRSDAQRGWTSAVDDNSQAVDLAHAPSFRLGVLHVEPSLRLISVGNDQHQLQPKIMQLLVALARQPGVVLSRDDLIRCCWSGRAVGDDSINRVVSMLRNELRQLVQEAVTIETLTKVGYRLKIAVPEAEQRGRFSVDIASNSDLARFPGWLVERRVALTIALMALTVTVGLLGWQFAHAMS